ncbi:amidase [Cohnella sp. REN36]|uniref:amidase n=1 Tax=Cohnella sp. REN36 TaxID=2887347 RepID=UPI001D140B81|nr:amidase [Cohnella sp. REN36]MCC3372671.1 amidase [Cohnella sp. REN36]
MQSGWNAYIKEDLIVEPTGKGALSKLDFAVKDVFAIAGHANSAGNPDWLDSHGPAAANAEAVDRLLRQGARVKGAAITDELMFSLNGENHYYGTPVNPCAPNCIPGGSSSGSAVAVAAGQADFALGTDTGGSVRVPSSYCGLFGIRPTHGLVPSGGVIPLAESFDTVGWMARDAETLRRVGQVLIGAEDKGGEFRRLIVADDAWAIADKNCGQVLAGSLAVLERVMDNRRVTLASKGLADWAAAFRTLQGYEIWSAHGEWIAERKPRFGPGIAERFVWASTLRREDYDRALPVRERIREELGALLGDDGLLVIPTAPCAAPRIGLAGAEIERTRTKVMQLSCIAGLGGLPQVTMPFRSRDGLPVGLSFIAGPRRDLRLLRWVGEAAVRTLRGQPVTG